MLEMLTYPFFRHALFGVVIISVAAAIIGTYIVARRLVSISGGITHACFGGLGLGYFLGWNPILSASLFAIASSAAVEFMARCSRIREDSAIAVIWAVGMAIGIIFVFLTPGYVPELNTFLFGNVLTISRADLWSFAIFTIVLIAFVAIFYHDIIACAFDPDFARVMHRPVRFINYSMTVLVAVCIVLTIRLVGVMLLMSMLVMPQIIAEIFCRRFPTIMLGSVIISMLCCIAGLLISSVVNVPCSALIVAIMVTAYILIQLVRLLVRLIRWIVHLRPMAISTLLLIIAASPGCSLKKNTAASRQYSAFITRYNIYFNGDEHFKQTLKEMENKYEDDYSQLLYMHPAEAFANDKAPQPTADFKRSIEKGQKAIQLRSIKKRPARKAGKSKDPEYKKWLQREEYNPFLHNAWMMMARSQYFGGDFLGAASTFFYISKHFWWLPATVTEAKLWQARSYCAIDWLYEAETLLNSIKEKDLEGNSTLTNLYNFTMADFLIRSKLYDQAIPWLVKAAAHSSGSQKARLTFLLGQLYQRTGNSAQAYRAFKKVGSMSGATHRTKFNARIKQSEVFEGSDIKKEVKALKALTRYDANQPYLDQIYYAIGNLYLSRADTLQAIDNYTKAIASSTRNGIDKALAQITLGQLYFSQHLYEKAQPCYSEALPLLPDNYPDYEALKRRSDVLDELAIYSQNVTTQDSLLRLSYLSRDEQLKVIDKIISDLKRREKEEAENAAREQYLQDQAAAGTGLQQSGSNAPTTFALNTDKSWYFYNTATRNAGRTEFQKRWGSRKLEDDWRRRNKAISSFSFADEEDSDASADSPSSTPADSIPQSADTETAERASDPHFPEYYLNQIPSTDAERATANEVIQEGLYNMGIILKDKLEDFPAAESEFTRLLTRYPDNIYRLDVYYNMYLMYMRTGNISAADTYRDLIIRQFPDSKYGEALLDPNYMDKLLRMPQVEQQLYNEAYDAYMANDNATVHNIYSQMRADYPMSRIMPKFMFIEALSYVAEQNPTKFSETLKQLVERYPDTDVAPLATDYIRQLEQGRTLNSHGSNLRGMIWSTRLSTSDSISAASLADMAQFEFDADGPHLLALIFPAAKVNANQLLFDVARHNFSTYMVRDFDLELLQYPPIDIIVISGFDSQREVVRYRDKLQTGQFRLPPSVVPLIISRHNFDILTSQGRTLEEYFEAADDHRIDQIHSALTEPEPQPAAQTQTHNPPSTPQAPQTTPSAPITTEPELEPITEPLPQTDPDEYDIPIPLVPVGTPPVAPRIK